MLGVMSRDGGKRHQHHHRVRKVVGDQADPTPWDQQKKSLKHSGQS